MEGAEARVTVGVTVDHILQGGMTVVPVTRKGFLQGGMAVALVIRKGFLQGGMAVALVVRKGNQEALATAAALGVLHPPRGETAAPRQMSRFISQWEPQER